EAVYRRGGHADRIAHVEGYHEHQFSVDNQRAALAFLDRFNGFPAGRPLPEVRDIDERALQVTRTGQVRLDHPDGRSLMDEIRDYYSARRGTTTRSLAAMYSGDGYPGIGEWNV